MKASMTRSMMKRIHNSNRSSTLNISLKKSKKLIMTATWTNSTSTCRPRTNSNRCKWWCFSSSKCIRCNKCSKCKTCRSQRRPRRRELELPRPGSHLSCLQEWLDPGNRRNQRYQVSTLLPTMMRTETQIRNMHLRWDIWLPIQERITVRKDLRQPSQRETWACSTTNRKSSITMWRPASVSR